MSKSFKSELNKLKRQAKKLHGTQNVPLNKLFSASFMSRYTSYNTIDDFFDAGGFVFETTEEFENLPEDKLDQYVRNSTKFKSWNEMQTKAGEHFVAKELGF